MKKTIITALLITALSIHALYQDKSLTPQDQLLRGARAGKLDEVKSALKRGVQIDYQDKDGKTALLEALSGSFRAGIIVPLSLTKEDDKNRAKLEVITFLLDSYANPNKADKLGNTPLYLAIKSGSPKTTTLLLEAGANPLAKVPEQPSYGAFDTHDTITILEYAFDLGTSDIVKLLQPFKQIQTAATKTMLEKAIAQGYSALVSQLLTTLRPSTDEIKHYATLAQKQLDLTKLPTYKLIGQMLRQRFGLMGPQLGISKQGIIGGYVTSGPIITKDIAQTMSQYTY